MSGKPFDDLKLERKKKVKTFSSMKNLIKICNDEITVNPTQLFNRIACRPTIESSTQLEGYMNWLRSALPCLMKFQWGKEQSQHWPLFYCPTHLKVPQYQSIHILLSMGGTYSTQLSGRGLLPMVRCVICTSSMLLNITNMPLLLSLMVTLKIKPLNQ